MKTQFAKEVLYYRELYERYNIKRKNIENYLKHAYEVRYMTPYYCQAYEDEIKKWKEQLENFPSFDDVKMRVLNLQEACPHDIIDIDTNQCMLCHKPVLEENKEKLYYSEHHIHTSNLTFEHFLEELIKNYPESELDLVGIMRDEFYNYKNILLIGGMMVDNPLLYEEDNQDQVYQLLSALKHTYLQLNHNVSVIGTRKACLHSYLCENLKTYPAYSTKQVSEILNQLQHESFDYIIDTLEQQDLKTRFPNSTIISYFNESHIDIAKMHQYQIDYAFSTASYLAHDFKYYMKDGTIKSIAYYQVSDIIKTLILNKK